MASRLARWPFDEVWDEVRHVEDDAVDGQFSQLREAGSQVDVVGFDGLTRHPRASNCPGRAADQGAAAAAYKVMWSAVNGLTPGVDACEACASACADALRHRPRRPRRLFEVRSLLLGTSSAVVSYDRCRRNCIACHCTARDGHSGSCCTCRIHFPLGPPLLGKIFEGG